MKPTYHSNFNNILDVNQLNLLIELTPKCIIIDYFQIPNTSYFRIKAKSKLKIAIIETISKFLNLFK